MDNDDILPSIGFVILSHANPDQLLRLVRTLNALYLTPRIACHHDVHQTSVDPAAFPDNVVFVQPAFRTGWGKFGVVDGFLAALRLLYAGGGPDWFVLLSAADYPIRPREEVLRELRASRCDALIDGRPVKGQPDGAASYIGEPNPKLGQFDSPGNADVKWGWYLGLQIWLPLLRRHPRLRLGRFTYRPRVKAWTPFRRNFTCFCGDHWFTANRRAAGVLLQPTPLHHRLARHLRRRPLPEENYYQTVLANEPGLTLCRDNKRYAEWNGGGAHPMNLGEAQWAEARASGAHFARKFAPDAPVLDTIDRSLGVVMARQA